MKAKYLIILTCLIFLFAAVSPLQAQEEEGQPYIIQLSDSLWKLANKYLGDGNAYPSIVEATAAKAARDPSFSPITNPNLIVPGQKIWIPAAVSPVAAVEMAEAPTDQATPSPALAAVPATAIPPTGAGGPAGHIAFSFWNNHPARCTYEINIVSVPDCLSGPAQCQATRRIFKLNNVSEPALSPDGTRLAFRGWGEPPTEDNPYFGCAPAHPYRFLGHTTLDGTEFIGTGGFWEDSHPDWSPDGQRLIFDSGRNGDGITRIYTIDATGDNEQNMFIAGQQPSWAPDGQRFVYRGCDLTGNRCGLWVALAVEPKSWETGINMIGPVIQAEQVAHPDWSPTRDEIVYQRNENGNWNLWLVNVDGSNDHRLTSGPTIEGLPDWSPDGNWVAYLAYDGRTWQIRIVSRDGRDDRHIFTYDGGFYAIPRAVEPYGVRDWIDEQISWSR
jgi:hypothetical protein